MWQHGWPELQEASGSMKKLSARSNELWWEFKSETWRGMTRKVRITVEQEEQRGVSGEGL